MPRWKTAPCARGQAGGAAERIDHADEDRGHEGAADRADAADHDDDEGEDQDVLAMPICTVRIGACISPARPASAAPSPNTSVNKSLMLMPSAPDHLAVDAPARISMPMRVRITTR